jgi:hypothetical protein
MRGLADDLAKEKANLREITMKHDRIENEHQGTLKELRGNGERLAEELRTIKALQDANQALGDKVQVRPNGEGQSW